MRPKLTPFGTMLTRPRSPIVTAEQFKVFRDLRLTHPYSTLEEERLLAEMTKPLADALNVPSTKAYKIIRQIQKAKDQHSWISHLNLHIIERLQMLSPEACTIFRQFIQHYLIENIPASLLYEAGEKANLWLKHPASKDHYKHAGYIDLSTVCALMSHPDVPIDKTLAGLEGYPAWLEGPIKEVTAFCKLFGLDAFYDPKLRFSYNGQRPAPTPSSHQFRNGGGHQADQPTGTS